MELRLYQERMIYQSRIKLREIKARLAKAGETRGPRLLLQCPTGGGKTAISAFIVKSAVANGKRVYFLCHRDFLVDQTSKTYNQLQLDYSHIAAGRWYNRYPPIHIGMVQTVRSRLEKVATPDICIWDEAHHIGAATWAAIMDAWPNAVHIGLTATPCRLDGKGLDTWFDDIVLGPTVQWLIENQYLSDYRAYAPSSPDLTALHTRAGDYVAEEVDEIMDRSVIIGDMVRDYRLYAPGMRAVYFCASIKHSKHVADAFNAAGIPARHLDGEHQTWEREHAARQLADGELMVLTNRDLFGEGYDLAAQAGRDVTIDCVGLARPTQSLGLFMQQVGRALRPKPHPAVILDHAGNIMKHGLPDEDREWTLKGAAKTGGGSTVRQCEECFAMIPVTKKACPNCGHVKQSSGAGAREVEQKDGDLHEIDKDRLRKAKKLEEWQAGSLEELIEIGRRRGYDRPEKWAGYIWTSKKERENAKEYARKQQLDFYQQLAIERYGGNGSVR